MAGLPQPSLRLPWPTQIPLSFARVFGLQFPSELLAAANLLLSVILSKLLFPPSISHSWLNGSVPADRAKDLDTHPQLFSFHLLQRS